MAYSILGICGSLRAASTNRLLMAEARRIFAPDAWDEGGLRLPIYDGDVEAQGMPEAVTRLHAQIGVADAVVIATPEYNKAVPGGLKNALDWVSRIKGNPWLDKPVAIMSAAAGRNGGDRSQFALRLAMTPFRPRLITGPEVLVADSRNAFDAEGRFIDERYTKALTELMEILRREIDRGR